MTWASPYLELDQLQRTSPSALEGVLLDRQVVGAPIAIAGRSHANAVWEVVLDNGQHAVAKPRNGVDLKVAAYFGHDADSTTIAECATWLVAGIMDPAFAAVVVPTVLRDLPGLGPSALMRKVDGGKHPSIGPTPFLNRKAVRGHEPAMMRAAFVDLVCGQSDRAPQDMFLAPGPCLIDNGFAFPRRGDQASVREVLRWRWKRGRDARLISEEETEALSRVIAAAAAGKLTFLGADRVEALVERCESIAARGRILRGALTWRVPFGPTTAWRW